jgi:hypothetical protein
VETLADFYQALTEISPLFCLLGEIACVAFLAPNKKNDRLQLLRAAKGFLRTYYHLIKYESDFDLAQSVRLSPQNITWMEFSKFISEAQSIRDDQVSPRYCYGEIRLRLNFYSPFFLHGWRYEWDIPQYNTYFGRLYGHILLIFAMLSLVLSAMQVELAAESIVGDKWQAMLSTSRYFSVICILVLALIALSLISTLMVMVGNKWVYALGGLRRKRKNLNCIS